MSHVFQEVIAQSFLQRVNEQIQAGRGPKCLQGNPEMVGQVIHHVLPGKNVYLMICEETGSTVSHIKIGVAVDILKRWTAIRCDNPLPVKKIVYFYIGDSLKAFRCESKLHEFMGDYHQSQEWFAFKNKQEFAKGIDKIVGKMRELMQDEFNVFMLDPEQNPKGRNHLKLKKYYQSAYELTCQKFMVNG